MYSCLFFWITLSICVIFYLLARIYGNGEWGRIDSDTFVVGIMLSLTLFFISYFMENEEFIDRIKSNHHNYSQCVRLNTEGFSNDAKLDSMPKAKQLCAELYNKSI
mgnify:CR=1 FL=1